MISITVFRKINELLENDEYSSRIISEIGKLLNIYAHKHKEENVESNEKNMALSNLESEDDVISHISEKFILFMKLYNKMPFNKPRLFQEYTDLFNYIQNELQNKCIFVDDKTIILHQDTIEKIKNIGYEYPDPYNNVPPMLLSVRFRSWGMLDIIEKTLSRIRKLIGLEFEED